MYALFGGQSHHYLRDIRAAGTEDDPQDEGQASSPLAKAIVQQGNSSP
jgi:hypothetical protein